MYVIRVKGTDKYISKNSHIIELRDLQICTTYKNSVGAKMALNNFTNWQLNQIFITKNQLEIIPVRLIVDE